MPDEFNKSKHEGRHDLPQLQSNLRRSESLRGGLTAINAREDDGKKYTIGDHSFIPVPKRTLVLALDPQGDLAPPAGSELVCRGSAYVEGDQKQVAAFRNASE